MGSDDRQRSPSGRGIGVIVVVVLGLLALGLFSSLGPPKKPYDEFLDALDAGKVAAVDIHTESNTVDVRPQDDGAPYETAFPDNTEPDLLSRLRDHDVKVMVEGKGGGLIGSLLLGLLPVALLIGAFVYLSRRATQGGGGMGALGQMRTARARRPSPERPKIAFGDVAGADEAVEELREIKDFLEEPRRFQALGARIPSGVILCGPPGTGKTLLARAVAGEAGVPFFSISGSDFVEMFVGLGASRVRDLFERAKKEAPALIFMDEIDAVGRHRGAGIGGGHDEREQTLNQILVEMDGFEPNDSVIMIAATNRPDILDPALLRPGRFDRQITVDRPDRAGRERILEVHARGKPLEPTVDVRGLAAQTPGFTGADLANLVNEAALLAARARVRQIRQADLQEAMLRVIAGPERKTRVLGERERLVTAYHEMGHAIVGHALPHGDPVRRISIIARGQSLGHTISLPDEDRFLTPQSELRDRMAMMLGGRVAVRLVFGELTTGAADDLERVTQTAKQMVMRFGMSDTLGSRVFGERPHQPFVGREHDGAPDYSDEIARAIDVEVRRVVDDAEAAAERILTERRHHLDHAAQVLVERETLEGEELAAVLAATEDGNARAALRSGL